MRTLTLALAVCALASCALVPRAADPTSDAPEPRRASSRAASIPASYAKALEAWHSPEDVNAWIGARFEYDFDRAVKLSETQRARVGRVEIVNPDAFFTRPTGICVDLARFGVETLRAIAPQYKPAYLMIEFDPVVISGNMLRLHWLVMFVRDGKFYFFADSKRPGHMAGPFATVEQFIEQYAQYRGRRIVSNRGLESYQRKLKQQAPKASREARAELINPADH